MNTRRSMCDQLAEARREAGAAQLSGHDFFDMMRFDPNTRHMIVFDVLSYESPVGCKGDKMRLFLSDTGYRHALVNQENGMIGISNHADVRSGHLHYDHKDHDL